MLFMLITVPLQGDWPFEGLSKLEKTLGGRNKTELIDSRLGLIDNKKIMGDLIKFFVGKIG